MNPLSVTPASERLLRWAEVIICMEDIHGDFLQVHFPEAVAGKRLVVLEIPDSYLRDDPELIALLRERLSEWVK